MQEDIEMQDEATSPIPNPVFPPASQLRRAFFSDLDESSRVNPNRRRAPSVAPLSAGEFATVRTIVVGAVREDSPAIPSPSPPREVLRTAWAANGETERGKSGEVAVVRRSVNPREDFGEELADAFDDDVMELTTRTSWDHGSIRAASAVIANAAAGSLAGVAFRRVSSAVLTNIGAGILVTQLLCFMGYATVDWRRLLADMWGVACNGVPPVTPEQAQHRLQGLAQRMLITLTATIPRRLSFWIGAAAGLVLL